MGKQKICNDCGWKSKIYPNDARFAGLGGLLSCPRCFDAKENYKFDATWGSVKIVAIDD